MQLARPLSCVGSPPAVRPARDCLAPVKTVSTSPFPLLNEIFFFPSFTSIAPPLPPASVHETVARTPGRFRMPGSHHVLPYRLANLRRAFAGTVSGPPQRLGCACRAHRSKPSPGPYASST